MKPTRFRPHVERVSVENRDCSWRIAHLQRTPARVRFFSIEPLLGPVQLNQEVLRGINWISVGGESGPKARRMKPEWVFDIKRQCEKSGVAFFFKQWGAYDEDGNHVGKKVAGRILEGRTWDGIPPATDK